MMILEIKNLNKDFYLHRQERRVRGCRDISFSLPCGGFLGVVGKSGSGKSTVLRCIYRTYEPMSGRIQYDSALYGPIDLATATDRRMLRLRRAELGYVSQFLSAMPRTTAREHVRQGVEEAGLSRNGKAEDMLAYFQLPEALWDLYPNTFSGGERLRLNLARAMVKEPRLLLLDEPTASLDQASKQLVRSILLRLKAKGTSIVGIFHDLEFMDGVCDQVFRLTPIEGEEGP